MKSNFDPKKYVNKDRVYRAVSGAPRVSRLYVWNGETYVPSTSKCFMAKRYEPSPEKGQKRTVRFFDTFEKARKWQNGEKSSADFDFGNEDAYRVSDLLNDWRDKAWHTLRESTKIYYNKAIERFEYLYRIPVEKIVPAHIDGWLNHLKSQPKICNRRKDFRRELEILVTVLRWYIDNNDDAQLRLPFKSRHKKMMIVKEGVTRTKKFMTPEELGKWLTALKQVAPELFVMGFVQVAQMMRVSEVAAMKWSNLNLEEKTYRMTEHVIWPRVNGTPPEIIGGTKNMKAGDVFEVPLVDEVIDNLKNHPRRTGTDLIFHDSGNVLMYRQIQFAYDKAFKLAGLPFRGTHVLRHTGATHFLNETGDYLALKQMGNWSELKVALGYGEIMKSRARDAIEKAKKRKLRLINGADDDGFEEIG